MTKDFENSFNAARNIGGYIVTIVSDAEWDFVKNNIINDNSNKGGNEGCVHVINSANSTDRRWNDIDCEFSNSGWSSPWRDIIIEFER